MTSLTVAVSTDKWQKAVVKINLDDCLCSINTNLLCLTTKFHGGKLIHDRTIKAAMPQNVRKLWSWWLFNWIPPVTYIISLRPQVLWLKPLLLASYSGDISPVKRLHRCFGYIKYYATFVQAMIAIIWLFVYSARDPALTTPATPYPVLGRWFIVWGKNQVSEMGGLDGW